MIRAWIGVLRGIRLISLWLGAFLWIGGLYHSQWFVALNGAVLLCMGAILFPRLIHELENIQKP